METKRSIIFCAFLAGLLVALPPAARADEDTAAAEKAKAAQTAVLAAKWDKATLEELQQAVNQLADAAIQLSHKQDDTAKRLNFAAQDPLHTSPEIEELRRKAQQLENELLQTHLKIRQAVEALPEVKKQREAMDAERAKITELQAERIYVQQLYQKRLREKLDNLDGN